MGLSLKKDTKKKIITAILNTLRFAVPIISVFWIGGLVIEMSKILSSNSFGFFMNYGQISLTLFGFTLVGAIFEKERKSKTVKKLFLLSILFLSSAIGFFALHSLSYYTGSQNVLNIAIFSLLILIFMTLAFIGFVYGLWLLLTVLIIHWKEEA